MAAIKLSAPAPTYTLHELNASSFCGFCEVLPEQPLPTAQWIYHVTKTFHNEGVQPISQILHIENRIPSQTVVLS